jgi:hypothetical protein
LTAFFETTRQNKTKMARIPEAEIERLKREIALERLVEARGVVGPGGAASVWDTPGQ